MKQLLGLLPALVAAFPLHAGEAEVLAAVARADDERVAATIAADPARLEAAYSDSLHYAHSNGLIDNKTSFIELLTSQRSDYQAIDYARRDFTAAGPGVVLMKGRALIRLGGPEGPRLLDLNYLAVWREEGGRWRFLAWQSCRNPPPAAPATK